MKRRAAIILGVCLAASVIEGVLPRLLHLREARVDLLLSVVLYLALHDEVIAGAALSLAAGYLSDVTSATPACLSSALAMVTFLVARVAGSTFRDSTPESALLAFAASLIHSALGALLVSFAARSKLVLPFSQLVWSALFTACAAPLVFHVLRRIDARFGEAAAQGSVG